MKRILLGVILALAVSAPALATPDYDQMYLCYDSYGNLIGERDVMCGYPWFYSWGDTSGDICTFEIIGPCNNNVEPITCQDSGVGMTSVGENCSTWCVTEGYALSYYLGMVPDCEGSYCSENGYGYVCNP